MKGTGAGCDIVDNTTREKAFMRNVIMCATFQGIQFSQQLRDNEHGGRSMVHVLGESSRPEMVKTGTDDDWHSNAEFYAALGGSSNDAHRIPSDAGDDAQHEVKTNDQMRLIRSVLSVVCRTKKGNVKVFECISFHFSVSDRSGRVQLQEVVERPLSYKQLDSSVRFCVLLLINPCIKQCHFRLQEAQHFVKSVISCRTASFSTSASPAAFTRGWARAVRRRSVETCGRWRGTT